MRESTIECINNCLRTLKGSHPFYRQFGLDTTDNANQNIRNDIIDQNTMFYPEIELSDISIKAINDRGQSTYSISLKDN